MTVRTRAQINGDADTSLADNTSAAITPAHVRARVKDLADSVLFFAPRIGTTASSSTPTPDGAASDAYTVTALAANATFGAPSGTPADGQKLIIRIKDNGTARTLAWNAIYRAMGAALPATTVISKTLYCGFIYNAADTKWDLVAVAQEA